MPELENFKRQRVKRKLNIPDGNCTPSDSDTDSDEPVQRKQFRRDSNSDQSADVDLVDGESSNDLPASGGNHQLNAGNSQLLYAALEKIQELENELAELDEADYDSGHQDEAEDESIDEGNASDFEENIQLHDHRDAIIDGQAEALGFAFCVKETFEYLAAQGISQDNPIVTTLRARFLGQCNQVPFQ